MTYSDITVREKNEGRMSKRKTALLYAEATFIFIFDELSEQNSLVSLKMNTRIRNEKF